MSRIRRSATALLVFMAAALLSAPVGVFGAENAAGQPAEEETTKAIYEEEEGQELITDTEEPSEGKQKDDLTAMAEEAVVPEKEIASDENTAPDEDVVSDADTAPDEDVVSEAETAPDEDIVSDAETAPENPVPPESSDDVENAIAPQITGGPEESADDSEEVTIEEKSEENVEEIAVTTCAAGNAVVNTSAALTQNGWRTEKEERFYYINGKKTTGIRYINGKKYVFGASGALVRNGWVTVGSRRVHTDKNGCLQTGWKTICGRRYYLSPKTGAMKKGLVTIKGKKYYFTVSGKLRKNGKVQVGKNIYKSDRKGILTKIGTAKLKKGWKKEEGARFYYVRGKRVTGVRKIKGKNYLFDPDGRLAKNRWVTIKGKTYYADKKGRPGTGLQKIGDKYYLFGKNGVKQTGRKNFGGKTYYFDPAGVMRTGMVKEASGTYCYGSDGALVTDREIVIDGTKYVLDSTGKITAVKRTVHHNAEGHPEWVKTGTDWIVSDEAWDEPVYELMYSCTYWAQGEEECGFMDRDDDVVAYHVASVHGRNAYINHLGSRDIPSWASIYVQTGTIHHPAGEKKAVDRYEKVYVEDSPAWDEEVIDFWTE